MYWLVKSIQPTTHFSYINEDEWLLAGKFAAQNIIKLQFWSVNGWI